MPKVNHDLELARKFAQFAGNTSRTPVTEFVPNSDQKPFTDSKLHELIAAGGNSSGKSFCGLIKCAHHLLPEIDVHGRRTGFTIHPTRRIRLKPQGIEGWISTWSEKTQLGNIKPVYEKILGPYEKGKSMNGKVREMAEFDTGRIVFKRQTQGIDAYKGDKEDFIMCDEPHRAAIYGEAKARLLVRSGTIWTTATFVMDESYTDMQIADVMWMQETIIEPWLADPKQFPETGVFFFDTKKNKEWVDFDLMMKLFATMSEAERTVRTSGKLIQQIGRACFNEDMIRSCQSYLIQHPEERHPDYVKLSYESDNWDDGWHIVPRPTGITSFPDKPKVKDGYVIKIWEHPKERRYSGMLGYPNYYIGVDASGGTAGGDYTAVYVIRGDNRQVVAALHGYITETELAEQLWLIGEYYRDADDRRAMLAIEVVNAGKVALNYLLTGSSERGIRRYGRSRIYHRPKQSDLDRARYIPSKIPGWYTSSGTRDIAIAETRKAVGEAFANINMPRDERYCSIPDTGFWYECKWFIMDKTGKYKAKPGVANDDRIFALGIANICANQYERRRRPDPDSEPAYTDEDKYYYDNSGNLMINDAAFLQMGRKPKRKEVYL